MDSMTALICVNVAIWLGIGGYIAFLAAQQSTLNKKIQIIESEK